MYIHSVRIQNFKSLGETNNNIIIEPQVTAIIGKNESGKSNVIDGLSYISINKKMIEPFKKVYKNRSQSFDSVVTYEIVFRFTEQEKQDYNITNDTIVEISENKVAIKGGMEQYFNRYIKASFQSINILLEENPFTLVNNQDIELFKQYKNDLERFEEYNYQSIITIIIKLISWKNAIIIEKRNELYELLLHAKEQLGSMLSIFPVIFSRSSDKALKSQYSLKEVQEELDNPLSAPNSLLTSLISVLNISKEELIIAIQSKQDGHTANVKHKINQAIKEKINIPFRDFYSQEQIELSAEFSNNNVMFCVSSSKGGIMELSERSNGLKWYLNFFIEMQGNQLPNQNVVYLLDEPGMSLHINAQKELLNLFNHIAGNNNQVIYTAHSPYMIDTNKIQCIRAIEKDELGFTHIYKTAYDSKLSSASKEDTLSPIINALGMNLCSTFGPAKDKLNVVTEGISDYIYITTMAIYLNVSLDKYALIASMGATNCINICTILCGWGCPYVALFDFDNEGVEKGAEVFRKDFYLKLGKEYLFIADVTQEDINQKKYKRNPIMIEDIVTVDELDQFRVERSIASDLSKPLLAKIYSNCVKEGTWKPSEKCVMNFKQLFSKLDMIYY